MRRRSWRSAARKGGSLMSIVALTAWAYAFGLTRAGVRDWRSKSDQPFIIFSLGASYAAAVAFTVWAVRP
jgi:hypothetical protein